MMSPPPLASLAQVSTASGVGRVLAVVGIAIVFVVVCGLIVMHIRKRLLADERAADQPPLLLEELRAMRRRGELSEQEFEAMRRRLVERLSRDAAPSTRGLSTDPAARPASMNGPRQVSRPTNTSPAPGDVRQARPGFDLTGDPLPGARPASDPGPAPGA